MLNNLLRRLLTPVMAVLLFTVLAAVPAAARIECRGNFQITKYGPISTPYCEERQIARRPLLWHTRDGFPGPQ